MERTQPDSVPSDTKDWTSVIEAGCPECGYRLGLDEAPEVAARLRAGAPRWVEVLARPAAASRPQPQVWSPLEYGCHVRDVCRVFRGRLELMLAEDDPQFPNWDQDATAVTESYWNQQPDVVAGQYAAEAAATADAFERVTDDQWQRPGRRSNGSQFTVASLAVYFLHDIEHHLHDVAPR